MVTAELARRLVAAQFPRWADLPIRPVALNGWDNHTFRLGDTMTVRLPNGEWYAKAVDKEHRWLPYLAERLPLPIPSPRGMGEPAFEYPYHWSVYEWIDGEPSTHDGIANDAAFAKDLANFLVALESVDSTDGPEPGQHNFFRGAPLDVYDDQTREALVRLRDRIPVELATEIWETALASAWERTPVWFHGDIATGNLLVRDDALAAVIDFGTSGTGDPACDLVITWNTFRGQAREAFRAGVGLDEDTWARARGWALWKALITDAFGVLDEIFGDYRR